MSNNKQYFGLTEAQVQQSRNLHGVNVLTPVEKESMWRKFLEKFSNPLILILLVAGFLSIGISFFEYFHLHQGLNIFFEPLGIFIAILLATGLAFLFEMKAEKEFALLNQVNDDEPVVVIRNGNHTTIPRRDVVVGDIVVLNTGEEIPADGQLLEAQSLNIDESTLTGEPVTHKTTDKSQFDSEATFPSDYVLRGTKILEGHGVMKVQAVGDNTENGKVFVAAQIDDSVKTPLNEQLEGLGKLISKISWGIAALIVVGRMVLYSLSIDGAIDWVATGAFLLQTIMIAVTLVVVAVPEGLPMSVTLSLAYSMRRMLKTNNLVRKMHACETMGATTVICTDKTGTLTQNQMQVAEVREFDGDKRLLEENMAINSTAELDLSTPEKPGVLGNPTEGALLLYLASTGVGYQDFRTFDRKLDEVPFSTERKYMASLVENRDGKKYLFVKGAPEIVYSLCKTRPAQEEFDKIVVGYQKQAMRTLGFAYAQADADNTIHDGKLVASDLTFQAVTAISDPVRKEVPDAVREALNAGIDVKIVTGDTPATAMEIGRQVGLWDAGEASDRNIITGPEFEKLTEEELRERARDLKIIARARPLDKKRLVEALQANNEVVAVTGDGTNDAPALKAAHVGLSMGDGTSVAKEASDITIVDNSFSSIGRAVMWGRSLFINIRRFVLFQMTVNVAACLIVLTGAFLGTQSPLTVTQMLWVNLIMDTFAAIALAALPPSQSVMRDKPRDRKEFIINRPMWNMIIGVGVVFFAILIALLIVFQHLDIYCLYDFSGLKWGVNGQDGHPLSEYEESLFFTIFVFLQFWNMFNARAFATGQSALNLRNCGEFVLIAGAILIGQVLIVEFGGEFFNVEPLKILDWVIIIGGTSLVLWIGECLRLFRRRVS